MTVVPPNVRFWSFVTYDPSGCLTWHGAKHKGYGQFQQSSYKTVRAHRWAYEYMVGPIPKGLTIDHECKNRACVRPGLGHCVPKSAGENALLGSGPAALNKRKTHCKRGHKFTKGNTIVRPGKSWRECKSCAVAGRRSREATK